MSLEKTIWVKSFTYHGTKKPFLESITEKGLLPISGFYGGAVYTKLDPSKTIGTYYNNDALVAIYHFPIKEKYALDKKEDWILFPNGVHPGLFLYVVEFNFSNRNKRITLEEKDFVNGVLRYTANLPSIKDQDSWGQDLKVILGNLASRMIGFKGYKQEKEKICVKPTV